MRQQLCGMIVVACRQPAAVDAQVLVYELQFRAKGHAHSPPRRREPAHTNSFGETLTTQRTAGFLLHCKNHVSATLMANRPRRKTTLAARQCLASRSAARGDAAKASQQATPAWGHNAEPMTGADLLACVKSPAMRPLLPIDLARRAPRAHGHREHSEQIGKPVHLELAGGAPLMPSSRSQWGPRHHAPPKLPPRQ